jgi:hypothetical protein
MRSFRAAIWTLGSGSLLLMSAALTRDQSLRRGAWSDRGETASRLVVANPAPCPALAGMSIDSQSPPAASIAGASTRGAFERTRVAATATHSPESTAGKQTVAFRNISHQPDADRKGPPIQFGPFVEDDSLPNRSATTDRPSTQPSTAPQRKMPELVSKVYRPVSMTGKELDVFLRPLLTPGVGTLTASMATTIDDTHTGVGGNSAGRQDVLVVRDLPEAVSRIDVLFSDLDTLARRVIIDALIVDVTFLQPGMPGLRFRPIDEPGQPANTASGKAVPAPTVEMLRSKFGVVDGDPSDFVKALEAAGPTSVLAANQVYVPNRQWIDLRLTEQDWLPQAADKDPSHATLRGAVRASARIGIRPSVLPDGLVRLELHPELSRMKPGSGSERPQLETIAFSTDIVLHAGTTAVIGGFVDERPADETRSSAYFEKKRSASSSAANGPGSSAAGLEINPKPAAHRELILLVMPRIARIK